ncbi:type II toxin-antitoxin system VapC family toxin [Methylovirgula sp. 4M-Z18]|uniref:type II toxin-antitoxin system VapC family toxin n=1 Tax=Methylovirgula sp. 4M-Z18 TaxID=2293567 RepID=UPI000E2F8250|nr:type II toxin-antitoxin system VapC family toxin [Methylovirgula sp. 4M-Z18]RFB81387.1 type II toxin-antitoxin system VapC family toxin [Methylovirgula sp. 4M-Z18]
MMILDTNVLSELMRLEPEPRVMQWITSQASRMLHTTSVTKAEILHGIALMPDGRRKYGFLESARQMFDMDFAGRVLPFDEAAAEDYAEFLSRRRKIGRLMSAFDAQIAAIARRHQASVATRNVEDFEGCGLALFNPWDA